MRLITCSLLTLLPALFAQDGQSSFGHARTREAAALGRLPTALEVAVADIVNYHRHRLPLPRGDDDVMLQLRFGNETVGVGDQVVLQFGYTTSPGDDRADLPPLNLALVIDRSGSMAEAGKMTAVKRALTAFVDRLRPSDRVAFVSYNGEPVIDEASRTVDDGHWLKQAISGLEASGATNLHGGLMLGLREVAAHATRDSSNRVLLLTDGIANRGETDVERILADARAFTAEDIDLSTIGVGRNLDIKLLDRLARGGRGLFHYVADTRDVQKVFVDEHESLVAPVARRVDLRLELPHELELVRVIGHKFTRRGDRLKVELPNLNRGATGVVLVVCKAHSPRHRERQSARVRGHLTFFAAGKRGRVEVDETLTIVPSKQELLRDPEVRKNYTIAVLAEGMHQMAVSSTSRRWLAADRALQSALSFSRKEFVSNDDLDVARVRKMAEDHSKTLRRYVDRFLDF